MSNPIANRPAPEGTVPRGKEYVSCTAGRGGITKDEILAEAKKYGILLTKSWNKDKLCTEFRKRYNEKFFGKAAQAEEKKAPPSVLQQRKVSPKPRKPPSPKVTRPPSPKIGKPRKPPSPKVTRPPSPKVTRPQLGRPRLGKPPSPKLKPALRPPGTRSPSPKRVTIAKPSVTKRREEEEEFEEEPEEEISETEEEVSEPEEIEEEVSPPPKFRGRVVVTRVSPKPSEEEEEYEELSEEEGEEEEEPSGEEEEEEQEELSGEEGEIRTSGPAEEEMTEEEAELQEAIQRSLQVAEPTTGTSEPAVVEYIGNLYLTDEKFRDLANQFIHDQIRSGNISRADLPLQLQDIGAPGRRATGRVSPIPVRPQPRLYPPRGERKSLPRSEEKELIERESVIGPMAETGNIGEPEFVPPTEESLSQADTQPILSQIEVAPFPLSPSQRASPQRRASPPKPPARRRIILPEIPSRQ